MDRINEQLNQLQELTDEQVAELESSILSEFENAEKQDLTPQTVESLESLANAVEAVRAEQSRRVAEAEALSQKASEAVARVKGEQSEETSGEEQQQQPANQGEQQPAQQSEAPADAQAPAPADAAAANGSSQTTSFPEEKPAKKEQDDAVPADTPAPSPDEPSSPEDEERKKRGSEDQPKGQWEEGVPPRATASNESSEETTATATEEPQTEASASEPTSEDSEAANKSEEPKSETEASADNEQTTQTEGSGTDTEAAGESESTTAEAPAEAENSNQNPEAPVTAAAQGSGDSPTIEPPADRRPQPKSTATLSITAGADIPGVSAGAKFNDMLAVADAFAKRLHSLRHVHGGDGEQHIVASLAHEFPNDRKLEPNDASENTDKIFTVTSPQAITAAAGICLPLETRYDLGCEVGVTDRPVRDSLARFGADRGGIRYFTSPQLTDETAATGFWRGDANGQNWATYGPDGVTPTNPANQKPCLEVQCTEENAAYIEAVTMCLTFNNLTTRVFPELIRRHNELALVAHARIAENHLLAQLEAGSTPIVAPTQVVGAARELFNLLGRTVAGYRHKHRMSTVSPLRMVAPSWLLDMLRADIALQMPGDGLDDVLGLAEAQINNWFRARNVNITWHLDGTGPAQVDTDTVTAGIQGGHFDYPANLEFGLWAEGTWLYLDGGTLDLGVIRDSSLVATNQYKQFVETFEGVANMGCDSYWVTAALQPTGQAASLVDTLP